VNITPTAEYREFEEVFGNRAARFEIVEPHTAMRIEAESVVDVRQHDPFRAFPADYRRTLPLRWMPWERRMLETYLEPVELPEVQLQELLDYGQGIVQANALDLAESLFALNLELFRQYEYRPGSTSFDTSPYDVYRNRFGVCQDFAQLFICIARLLDIPARYVCGYVNITDESGNPRPGATHAWVEVYLPDIGWKGLDPTNGSLPSGGHIRVATGRHYQDATPTTGWIEPAVQQDLSILVEVVELPLGP
jgi:transglutaminase-like putative cysteine protease